MSVWNFSYHYIRSCDHLLSIQPLVNIDYITHWLYTYLGACDWLTRVQRTICNISAWWQFNLKNNIIFLHKVINEKIRFSAAISRIIKLQSFNVSWILWAVSAKIYAIHRSKKDLRNKQSHHTSSNFNANISP